MPTLRHGGSCTSSRSPYIGKCGLSGANMTLFEELSYFMDGPLNSPAEFRSGSFFSFDQTIYVTRYNDYSFADTGYLYAPQTCLDG